MKRIAPGAALASALGLLLSDPAAGQDAAPPADEECRQELAGLLGWLEDEHPAVLAQKARAESVEEMGRVEGSIPDPRLSAELRAAPVLEPWNLGRTPMGGIAVGASQQVPWLPRLWAASSAKEHEAAAVRLRSGEDALELWRRAVDELVGLAALDEEIALLKGREELFRALGEVARANAMVGAGGETDAVLLEARAAQVAADVVAAEASRDALLARWSAVAGERPLPGCREVPLAAVEGELSERVRSRPILAALDEQVASARAKRRSAWHAWVPEPTLQAGYVWRPDPVDRDGVDFIGGMVSIPIPVGLGRRLGAAASASAAAESAEAERRAFLLEVGGALKAARAEQAAEEARIARLEEEALPVARAASDVAQSAYRAGAGNVNAILEAERAVIEIELALVEAKKQRALATNRLLRLAGGPAQPSSETPRSMEEAAQPGSSSSGPATRPAR